MDWYKYKDHRPIYETVKNKSVHHEGYLMDRTFISQNLFFKLFDQNGNKKYGETVIHFSGIYDAIHLMRKGIFTKFGQGQE